MVVRLLILLGLLLRGVGMSEFFALLFKLVGANLNQIAFVFGFELLFFEEQVSASHVLNLLLGHDQFIPKQQLLVS